MISDFLTDFWKGFIVALRISGSLPFYRVNKINLDKSKTMLLITTIIFAISSIVKRIRRAHGRTGKVLLAIRQPILPRSHVSYSNC